MDNSDQLPEDIVEKISTEHLDIFSQLIAFSGVCKSWRSAALLLPVSRRPCLPGLLVAGGQIHEFSPLATLSPTTPPPPPPRQPIPSVTLPSFPPSLSKLSDIPFHDEDGELAAHSLGSKDGWILRTLPRPHCDGWPLHLYLLNPLTGASIPLPPLPALAVPNLCEFSQAIISSSPDDEGEECHVFILFRKSPQLAWCKVPSSDSSQSSRGVRGEGRGWIITGKNANLFKWPFDAVCSGKEFYVLDDSRVVVYRNLVTTTSSSPSPAPRVRSFPFSEAIKSFVNNVAGMMTCCYHLCHIQGQVHVVLHRGDVDSFVVQVHKLVVLPPASAEAGGNNDTCYWKEVRSLDGHAVFFGPHQSFSLPASTTSSNGVRGNHIYFCSDHFSLRPDWFKCMDCDGVYDLVNQKFERFDFRRGSSTTHEIISRPYFWFLPMPWDISKLQSKTASEEGSEMGARYWTLPGKTMMDHDEQRSNGTSDNDNIVIDNEFQALVLDDE